MFMSLLSKNVRFWACFYSPEIATEALLHFNGATCGLQRSLRYTLKRPKTHSKSASVESQQALNRAKTAFFPVFSNAKF